MLRIVLLRLRWPLLVATAVALLLAIPTALAGSGVGGVFNLGQTNTVDAQSTLTGNPGSNPLLRLTGSGIAATLRVDAGSGTAVNGITTFGVGQLGQSTNGVGVEGVHAGGTGTGSASGVYGQTSSNDPGSAGVTGRNLAGGPGLQAIVAGNVPPLKVNSSAKVPNLNADLLDGKDSAAYQSAITGTCAGGISHVSGDGKVDCADTGVLPSGKTLRGVWDVFQSWPSTASPQSMPVVTTITFPEALLSAPTALYVEPGNTPPASCPGSIATPEASPGYLCIYGSYSPGTDLAEIDDPASATCSSSCPAGPGRYGAMLVFVNTQTSNITKAGGSWAVTAP